MLHGYRATIRTTDDDAVFLELVLDFRTGVGLELVDGGLSFTFDPPAAGDLHVTITQNPNHLPEALVTGVFGQVTPQVFASVQDVLPSFPLPGFAGMGLGAGRDRPGLVGLRPVRRSGPGGRLAAVTRPTTARGPAQRRAGPWCG